MKTDTGNELFFGPFDDAGEAQRWGERKADDFVWWIAPVRGDEYLLPKPQ